jgi:hypothetical protein
VLVGFDGEDSDQGSTNHMRSTCLQSDESSVADDGHSVDLTETAGVYARSKNARTIYEYSTRIVVLV